MESILKQYTSSQIEKAKHIKAIICDVDGVLTDGGIIYDNNGNEFKRFNVKDGQIISHLKRSGILVGAITGRESEVVKFRCKELNFDFHYHGVKNKLEVYLEIQEKHNLSDEQIAYIGDDIIDIPIFSHCGLGIAPSDALPYIFDHVSLKTLAKGGCGVLRESADFILASQSKMEAIINFYKADKPNL
ncbi:MAG: HAD-IIIA family hydrolase [Bacteroidota bacterium]|nr:HAD-IIIA family hydrolase [Bacteroidota bacterium]